MPRYTDAEPLELRLAELVKEFERYPTCAIGINMARKIVIDTPSADVEEVRHGEWIQCTNFPRMHWCSECNREVFDETDDLYVKYPYCHCGAKMDGGVKVEK